MSMKIIGLQKLTLLDYPAKVACTLFTAGCNLRCPFCHNASLVIGEPEDEIEQEEIFAFLQKRRGILDGVCVTGGEPLLQPDLPDFLRRVKGLGYLVKLDTNGCFPGRLKEIVSQSLVDYVAMDVKSSPAHYAQATGIPGGFHYAPVRESMDFLLSGKVKYEFRTTVVKGLHNAEILRDAAREIRGAKRYFLQKFVDSGDLIGTGMSAFTDDEMKAFLNAIISYVPSAALRGV